VRHLGEFDMWLVDSLAVPASLHEADGRFVHVNSAAERASGHSRSHLIGKSFTDLLPIEARDEVIAHFRRAVELSEPTDFETVFIDRCGRRRGVRAQHLPVAADGAVIGVLILAFAGSPLSPVTERFEHELQLTRRQHEILVLLDAGLSTSDMAKRLTLSTETVRNHVRSLLAELGVHTRVEAIAVARRHGLLTPPALRPLDSA
jgi:PAS domain S-box-containing protein